MVNNSATGGPLQPSPPPLLEGAALEDFFHDLIASLTLVDNTLVRPTPGYALQRHEQFGVICSFYGRGAGSDARGVAKLLRDNLAIAQNREPLFNQGMALIEVTAPIPAPSLVKEIWLYRVDLTIRIRRIVVRSYDVLTIKSAEADLVIDASTREIDRTDNAEDPSP